MRVRPWIAGLPITLLLGLCGAARAQDANVLLPADSAEFLMAYGAFQLPESLIPMRPAELIEHDRTQRAGLWYEDGTGVLVQWAPAPKRGEAFNNVPRYEVGAYELQKLYLDEPEYVVPPTALRMIPLEWYRTMDADVERTFDVGASVLVVLQYFLFSTKEDDVFDEGRFATDTTYARYWANANLFTYLIDHKDANRGNLRISTIEGHPRVFVVDNGVAFGSEPSNRGTRWSELQVDRFPFRTVLGLRTLTREGLQRALGVLAQWELRGGELVRVQPTVNWRPRRGIRRRDDGVQIGLTEAEIDDVWNRIEGFLARVDRGWIEVF